MKKLILIAFVFCAITANAESPVHIEQISVVEEQAPEFPNKETEQDIVFTVVEQMPQFPGGEAAMRKFISENLRYPKYAVDNGIQGRVVVRFIVQKDGSIRNIEVLRSLDKSLDQEAVRVIQLMPKWIPGKQNGKPVDVYFILPIVFKL